MAKVTANAHSVASVTINPKHFGDFFATEFLFRDVDGDEVFSLTAFSRSPLEHTTLEMKTVVTAEAA